MLEPYQPDPVGRLQPGRGAGGAVRV